MYPLCSQSCHSEHSPASPIVYTGCLASRSCMLRAISAASVNHPPVAQSKDPLSARHTSISLGTVRRRSNTRSTLSGGERRPGPIPHCSSNVMNTRRRSPRSRASYVGPSCQKLGLAEIAPKRIRQGSRSPRCRPRPQWHVAPAPAHDHRKGREPPPRAPRSLKQSRGKPSKSCDGAGVPRRTARAPRSLAPQAIRVYSFCFAGPTARLAFDSGG